MNRDPDISVGHGPKEFTICAIMRAGVPVAIGATHFLISFKLPLVVKQSCQIYYLKDLRPIRNFIGCHVDKLPKMMMTVSKNIMLSFRLFICNKGEM